ncbi:hypothetical protein V1477_014917 [Vespula maculifrons]|uniref:Uncharacterized protein n=1 Tax=Vespula maculifrons TaxID=7453 RepID=A0ABD2BIU3_VESMC
MIYEIATILFGQLFLDKDSSRRQKRHSEITSIFIFCHSPRYRSTYTDRSTRLRIKKNDELFRAISFLKSFIVVASIADALQVQNILSLQIEWCSKTALLSYKAFVNTESVKVNNPFLSPLLRPVHFYPALYKTSRDNVKRYITDFSNTKSFRLISQQIACIYYISLIIIIILIIKCSNASLSFKFLSIKGLRYCKVKGKLQN